MWSGLREAIELTLHVHTLLFSERRAQLLYLCSQAALDILGRESLMLRAFWRKRVLLGYANLLHERVASPEVLRKPTLVKAWRRRV